jgi:alcohol dehydrogenase, propanol-preferring
VTRNCASAILFFRSTSSVGKTLEQKSSNPVSGRRTDNLGTSEQHPVGGAGATSTQTPPEELDATLLFAPVGSLVPAALRVVAKGGVVVCGGIHMSDIPSFPYSLLWGERVVRSVANLTRRTARSSWP